MFGTRLAGPKPREGGAAVRVDHAANASTERGGYNNSGKRPVATALWAVRRQALRERLTVPALLRNSDAGVAKPWLQQNATKQKRPALFSKRGVLNLS